MSEEKHIDHSELDSQTDSTNVKTDDTEEHTSITEVDSNIEDNSLENEGLVDDSDLTNNHNSNESVIEDGINIETDVSLSLENDTDVVADIEDDQTLPEELPKSESDNVTIEIEDEEPVENNIESDTCGDEPKDDLTTEDKQQAIEDVTTFDLEESQSVNESQETGEDFDKNEDKSDNDQIEYEEIQQSNKEEKYITTERPLNGASGSEVLANQIYELIGHEDVIDVSLLQLEMFVS